MSPRKPAAPKPPKRWRRDGEGAYRDADNRFELAGDGAGRWFVRDGAATDELGLPRTTGPFATLAEAKAAADAQREAGAPASPLAARLEAARTQSVPRPGRRPGEGPKAGMDPASGQPSTPRATMAQATRSRPAPKPDAPPPHREASAASQPARAPAPAPAAPRKPTWLNQLEARDPAAARQARTLARALEDRGIDDAGALVRRDRLGGRPAVAERLLLLAIRERVAEALADAPGSPAERAAIATRVIAAVLEAISRGETGRSMPTWELVEGSTGRRLRPDASDRSRSTDPMPPRASARRRPTP